jgi:serine/threonine protein phosphatase 1
LKQTYILSRTLVFGDIHSGKRGLEQVLERAKVTTKDHLVFLGDYVDAWSEAFETVSFLIQLSERFNCTFLRGNHDDLCLNYLTHNDAPKNWLLHGGQATRDSYENRSSNEIETHVNFLRQLEDYRLDDNSRLFLHAGFTNLRGVEHEYFSKMFYWDRTLWELAQVVENSSETVLPPRLQHYGEIFIGHTPISKEQTAVPKRAANVWNIDTGAAFMGPVTALDVQSKEYWQSDPITELYPNEPGRNHSPK